MAARFDRYVAIDWSGAKGKVQKGIAVAVAAAQGGPPVLVDPGKGWSRTGILDLLKAMDGPALIGLDLGIGLPFADCGAYFPGLPAPPADAPALWEMVDRVCADEPDLAAGAFVDHPDFAPYFRRHGGREGTAFRCDDAEHGRGRFRLTEHAQAAMGCKPYSNFNLVGAAQVGKSSLTGMRMLHALRGTIPVWPVDPLPATGSVIVEIYTSLAAMEAGRKPGKAKMRDYTALNEALAALGSPRVERTGPVDDHSSDALLTAAWLRKVAGENRRWQPEALTPRIAATEGWTFGAL